jgi:hypothetical protein
MSQVWYVSYGSNMSSVRFACYIEGGRPPGGSRTNPGARDPRLPVRSVPVDLPGTLYFAGESPQWGGGVAFYDHARPGFTAARAYLVTAAQLADIAAQEMYRVPQDGDPLEEVVLAPLQGGRHELGPGRYETLAEAYLATVADGLRESRGWDDRRIASYFASLLNGRPWH